MNVDIVVVGSINLDMVIHVETHPHPGETVVGTNLTLLPGGKGSNQAVAAGLLGARVAMIGAVGNDSHADIALQRFDEARISTDHILRCDEPTGTAFISVSSTGENTIIINAGANARVSADHVRSHSHMVATAPVVVTQGEIPIEATAEACRLASGYVLMNVAPVIDVPADVLKLAHPLIVNEHEAALLLGQHGITASSHDTPERLIELLSQRGPRSVVLTLGEHGSLVRSEKGLTKIPPRRIDHVVDTTGAGDAFVGALAVQLSQGQSLEDAAHYASHVASLACTRSGAQKSYLPRAEIEAHLAQD